MRRCGRSRQPKAIPLIVLFLEYTRGTAEVPEAPTWLFAAHAGPTLAKDSKESQRRPTGRLIEFLRNLAIFSIKDAVLIQNADVPLQADRPFRVMAGDNRDREFSGWQKALDELVKIPGLIQEDTVICFANDTFIDHYGDTYLSWFDQSGVREALCQGKAVGYVDRSLKPVSLFGLTTDRWLRTSLFFIRWAELKAALPLRLPVAESEIFSCEGESLFLDRGGADGTDLASPHLSPNLRASLDRWLWAGPVVAGEFDRVWHSAERLSDESRPRLQQKAKCILIERLLSARLLQAGVELQNVRVSSRRWGGLFALADRCQLLEPAQNFRVRAGFTAKEMKRNFKKFLGYGG
ncbi:MAG: hypothetical protein C5B49_13905 [Bdellovibrio sp.]|nr:MAG: hypothetical protein C5B49_13905 [Bdellovibrio sp.]